MILDWVPGHFPKDAHGLARFDGTALYEHADPRQGEHQDWGTLIFNYGRNEVRNFLLSNALFWLEEYHVDGLRVDAVASMLYLDYSRKRGRVDAEPVRRPREPRGDRVPAAAEHADARRASRARSPSAEESTSWPGVSRPVHLGGLGFTYKWNMGWMHDMLDYVAQGSGPPPLAPQPDHVLDALRVHRELHPAVLARRGRARQARRCSTRCRATRGRSTRRCARSTATCTAHPGKKLLFMGGEFGQWREWNHDRSLDWHLLDDPAHAALRALRAGSEPRTTAPSRRCTRSTSTRPASAGSTATTTRTASSRSSATRATARDFVVMVFNFTPVPRDGLPHRRARARLLRRAAQQRRVGLRRQQRRQRRRRQQRAGRRARLRPVAAPDRPAARVPAAEDGVARSANHEDTKRTKKHEDLRVLRAFVLFVSS